MYSDYSIIGTNLNLSLYMRREYSLCLKRDFLFLFYKGVTGDANFSDFRCGDNLRASLCSSMGKLYFPLSTVGRIPVGNINSY